MINFRNIFGGGDYKMPEVPETKVEVPPKEESKGPAYQVGRTVDGRVTLRLGDGYYYSTLSMNNEGVDTLIRMLEAAKESESAKNNLAETEEE